MSWWLLAAAGLAGLAGSVRYNWWRPRRPGVPVLMYHHVRELPEDTPLPKLYVGPGEFRRQLDFLQKRGLRAITLGQALHEGCPQGSVVLTFDDAYTNFYTQAWPLLKERGMGATVFVVTGQVEGENAWDLDKGLPRHGLMSAGQIRELAQEGVEFGGHSHNHADLTSLDEAELAQDLALCQETLSDILGHPAQVFSYPYGLHDEQVRAAVAKAGFKAAATTAPAMLTADSDPLAIGRIIIKRRDNLIDFGLKLTRTRSSL